jgi:hypothetical protein
MMNRYFMYNGIEIPGIQPRIRIEYFSSEQQAMKSKESNENESQTKDD